MKNPLDEFLEEYGQTKEAFSFPQNEFGKAMVGAAGAAAATGVIAGAGMAANKIWDAATKSRDFRNMLSYNADLHEHHERDPRMFNQMFTSLRSMNPAFSKDPIVAGTLMRRMMDNPATAGGILSDVVSARDKFPSLINRVTDEGVSAGKGYFSKKKDDGQNGGQGGGTP